MAILIDLFQTVISACTVDISDEIKKAPENELNGIIKHVTYNIILSVAKKHSAEYGKIIIATDNRNYWRKKEYPAYKGHRKHSRDKPSEYMPWEDIMTAIRETVADIRTYMPWTIIEVESAEADDIIAVLSKYIANGGEDSSIMPKASEKCLIVSSDGDYKQLVQPYISILCPRTKKMFTATNTNAKDLLIEKIVTGDSGDNIPNIRTEESWSVMRANNEKPPRQQPITAARLNSFKQKGIRACQSDDEYNHYMRNQKLIDFNFIPETLSEKIIDVYSKYKHNTDKMKIFSYLTSQNMRTHASNIESFFIGV